MPNKFLTEYTRLSRGSLSAFESAPGEPGYVGGQADLTPLKNKAREAVEALNDAQKYADAVRTEDCLDALRRARAIIDAALGGALSASGAAAAPMTGPGYGGRY